MEDVKQREMLNSRDVRLERHTWGLADLTRAISIYEIIYYGLVKPEKLGLKVDGFTVWNVINGAEKEFKIDTPKVASIYNRMVKVLDFLDSEIKGIQGKEVCVDVEGRNVQNSENIDFNFFVLHKLLLGDDLYLYSDKPSTASPTITYTKESSRFLPVTEKSYAYSLVNSYYINKVYYIHSIKLDESLETQIEWLREDIKELAFEEFPQ